MIKNKDYSSQRSWRDIQKFLPQKLHFTDSFRPNEEWWKWKKHDIHLDTFRNASAKAKVILFHGVGTNGRQMSMIIGGPLAKVDFEVIAIDMPTYGMTRVKGKKIVTYDDWIQCGSDYIDFELEKDNRPIFLYGLSAGGMETYHIASENKKVKGIVGMTFLDQSIKKVSLTTAKNKFMATIAVPMTKILTMFGLGFIKMKIKTCSKMSALCNDKELLKIFYKDKTSAGNSVTMKFLKSYCYMTHKIEPEKFDICPILLTQPDQDRWSPIELSKLFLNKIKNVPVTIKILNNGGHYPIEQPALNQMAENIIEFFNKLI